MELETLDVRTAEGHTLKVGVCANGCTGPAVLILPGLFSHMGWYRPLGAALAERGASAFLVDRRGSGSSGGMPGHMDSWRHVTEKGAMVDNEVVLETLSRVERTPVRVEIFEGAHHVLPTSVPIDDLVERIHHWFTATEETLEPRVVVQRVQRVQRVEQPAAGALEGR